MVGNLLAFDNENFLKNLLKLFIKKICGHANKNISEL